MDVRISIGKAVDKMAVSARLLMPGTLVKIGHSVYKVERIVNDNGLTRLVYRTEEGLKSKSLASSDQVELVKQ